MLLDSYLEIDWKENCVTNAEREPNKVHKRITFCRTYDMTPDEEIQNNLLAAENETVEEEEGQDTESAEIAEGEQVEVEEVKAGTETEAVTETGAGANREGTYLPIAGQAMPSCCSGCLGNHGGQRKLAPA